MYDGSLGGIIDRFSGHKVITLQFADEPHADDLDRYGEVLDVAAPKARLRVERDVIARVLSQVLAEHTVEDVSVEDPPLEEVIADDVRRVEQRCGSNARCLAYDLSHRASYARLARTVN